MITAVRYRAASQRWGGNLPGMPRKNRGEKLTVPMVAKKLGITPSTWRAYVSKAKKAREAGKVLPSHAPPKDGEYDERTPWWFESTIDEWAKSRRGQGWRAGGDK